MATTYKSTLEINVWKEHACIGCGSRFRYLFKRKKTGQGNSPKAASWKKRHPKCCPPIRPAATTTA